MTTIKDITAMCRNGQIHEAYDLAYNDLKQAADSPWTQREMAWVLNYMLKDDCEKGDFQKLLDHMKELLNLGLLTTPDDNILFDNVLYKVARGFNRQVQIYMIFS